MEVSAAPRLPACSAPSSRTRAGPWIGPAEPRDRAGPQDVVAASRCPAPASGRGLAARIFLDFFRADGLRKPERSPRATPLRPRQRWDAVPPAHLLRAGSGSQTAIIRMDGPRSSERPSAGSHPSSGRTGRLRPRGRAPAPAAPGLAPSPRGRRLPWRCTAPGGEALEGPEGRRTARGRGDTSNVSTPRQDARGRRPRLSPAGD